MKTMCGFHYYLSLTSLSFTADARTGQWPMAPLLPAPRTGPLALAVVERLEAVTLGAGPRAWLGYRRAGGSGCGLSGLLKVKRRPVNGQLGGTRLVVGIMMMPAVLMVLPLAVVLVIVGTCIQGAAGDPGFTSSTISTVAVGAHSVFAADIDGDGFMDVLSGSVDDNKVAWYRNGGGSPPTWTPQVISSTAGGVRAVFAADVNADGRVDVLSANFDTDTFMWYKNGGGAAPVWTPYTIATGVAYDGPHSINAADLDGDGRVDVATACWMGNSIAWHKSGGGSAPTWTSYTISSTTMSASFVVVADVDGDGRLDVVSSSYSDDKIAWFRNGGGSPIVWTTNIISTTATGAHSVFVADMDGDGRLDALSASQAGRKVEWYKNGGGSPPTWTTYTVTSTTIGSVHAVYAADVDGDGRVDALACSENDNKAMWYKNEGGSPPAWTPYSVSTSVAYAASVFAAYVDSDGRLDVLTASSHDDKVAVHFNNLCPRGTFGTNGFDPCTVCPAGSYSPSSLQASCTLCPAGKFGTSTGSYSVAAACTGTCSAGYACPAGSTTATPAACGAGQYSLAGAGACTGCSPGTFGSSTGLTTAACSGLCAAGRFGSVSGLSSSSCEGACSAGYACPAGSTSATAVVCPSGWYSLSGWSVCSQCPVGLYGDTLALPWSTCTAPCPPGRFGSAPGLSTSACSGPCDAGRFGSQPGVNASSCTAACPAGYFCPPGTANATANVGLVVCMT
jgi:hypothetical protein